MEVLSFSDHFSSPFMTTITVIFLVLECISAVVFFLVFFQYQRVVLRHRLLPKSIAHKLDEEPEKGTTALLIAYIVVTVFVTLATFLLFWFQPHLF